MGKKTIAKQGEDLLLSLASKIYAGADTMSFEVTTETREYTTYKQGSGSDGKFVKKKAVKMSWSAQTDNAVMDYADYKSLIDLQIAGNPIEVKVTEATYDDTTGEYTESTNGFKVSGSAIITSLSCSAPKDGDVTVSIKLDGTGACSPTNTTGA